MQSQEMNTYRPFFLSSYILFALQIRRSKFWVGWVTWQTCLLRGTTVTPASRRSTKAPARSRDWWSLASCWKNTSYKWTAIAVCLPQYVWSVSSDSTSSFKTKKPFSSYLTALKQLWRQLDWRWHFSGYFMPSWLEEKREPVQIY